MSRALWFRSWRDSFVLLLACCALLFGFIWLRLWIVSQIDFAVAAASFEKMIPEFIRKLLPVPIEVISTIEGRVVFGFEELPVGLLLALWTVTRGTDCLAGRLGDGTMEMLLSQPIRRLTLVTSHTGVTVVGVFLLAFSSWLGVLVGILTVEFDETTNATAYWPAVGNLLCIGLLMVGIATLASALARTRAEAVAFFVGFYVMEIACKILGLMTQKLGWLKNLTFLTAYEPTKLTIGFQTEPDVYWPLFWQYNALLVGIGLVTWLVATTYFCRRDLPAPL